MDLPPVDSLLKFLEARNSTQVSHEGWQTPGVSGEYLEPSSASFKGLPSQKAGTVPGHSDTGGGHPLTAVLSAKPAPHVC